MSRNKNLIPIRLEKDPTRCAVTAHAGMIPYLDFWNTLQMPQMIDQSLHICGTQGYLDRQIILSLVALNLVGGDCVTDIDKLEEDKGFCQMFRAAEFADMSPRQRKLAAMRFRRARNRTLPAPTQIYSYLEACHDESQEAKRQSGKAFIPTPNENLKALNSLNRHLLAEYQKRVRLKTATLDGDATLVATQNKSALYCYKHFPAYQPYNIWWAEAQLVLESEFRDGNVPAGFDILRVWKETVSSLPDGIEQVFMRQDSAAYNNELMGWCERESEHPKYGRILFTISADVTPALREAISRETEWTPIYRTRNGKLEKTNREWAEVLFVSNDQALMTDIKEPFRYIVIRERASDQLKLDISEDGVVSCLGVPLVTMSNVVYRVSAFVTNRRDMAADKLIAWHYERCGKDEESHSIMKEDFAGGQLPSSKFGANAAWWSIVILSMNFQSLLKRFVLGSSYISSRMKAIRQALINRAGRIVFHARQSLLRVGAEFHSWLASLRERAGSCVLSSG